MAAGDARVVNAMTVDVEDYFHVSAFESNIARAQWGGFESRVTRNTERLLEMFEAVQVKGTFFVLGWIAERFPGLVRRIGRAGHEVASHGYEHRLVYTMSRSEFVEDIRRAKGVLEDACDTPILGYRAPSYSITNRSMWALDVLLEQGYYYDASIFPVRHDRYGIPDAPRHVHRIRRDAGMIWEMPGSTVRRYGLNVPIGGGGYFRLFPYAWTRRGIHHVNTVEKQPVVFYLHPWEIDPEQPRVRASIASRLRHYQNLPKTEPRLQRLLSEFSFCTASSVLSTACRADAAVEPSGVLELSAEGAGI